MVFLCTSDAWGGLEMNVVKLAAGLLNAGANISVISEENTPVLLNAINAGLDTIVIRKHKKYFDFINSNRLANLLRKMEAGFLFVFHNRDTDFAANVKYFNSKIKIIFQQQMHIGRKKTDFLHTLRFSKYDYWISPLKILADEVRTLIKFDPSKIRIIPLGADPERVALKDRSKNEIRNLLDLTPEKFTFGIIGRIDRQKGQLDVIKAANIVKNNYPGIQVLIMGEKTVGSTDNYFELITESIAAENLSEIVKIRPFNSDISLFFGAVDCFILASASETYGMVTIESMLTGVPIIGTSRGGTTEILANGEFGLLFTPRKYDELADCMLKMIEHYPNYLETAKLARNFALQNYTADIETKMILELISS